MTPEQERLAAILMPEATSRLGVLRKSPEVRFVHYTTAETALKIIKNRGIWMRNAFVMNDYSEVRHGLQCFFYSWNGEAGRALRDAMSKLHHELVGRFNDEFFGHFSNNLQSETYLTSLCEHSGKATDAHGRLSMWRAYGGDNGVALVIHNTAFLTERGQAGLFSSPVAYWDQERFAEEMAKVAQLIASDVDAFSGLTLDHLFNTFTLVFMAAVLCVKHPGFEEENEWRIFYNTRLPLSPLIEKQIEVVRGVPQPIYRLKLRWPNDPNNGDVSLAEVFDRMIIGPSAYPYPIYLALAETLEEAGIPDAREKVITSGIPLRR